MLSRHSDNSYNRLFLDVVQRNHAKVRFFCIRKTYGHHEQVPDLMQDILVRLWEERDTIPLDGDTEKQDAWLMSIVRKQWDRHRRKRRFLFIPLGPEEPDLGEPNDCDNEARLREWFASLTPYERNIIEWGLEGYTQKEIAERLGLKPATLRKQHERIIKKLKKYRDEKKEI